MRIIFEFECLQLSCGLIPIFIEKYKNSESYLHLRWWYTLCYYSFRPSTFNDIHNILVAHVVYTRPQNVETKSSGFAYTIIA